IDTSSLDAREKVLTAGNIIVIVVGTISGLALLIVVITMILCIVKHSNRSRNVTIREIILEKPQLYPNIHSWPNQYPSNLTSVANYPPPNQSTVPPYTATALI
ncbi:unnamed protein product, partial [Rotaria sp. Silwood1]